MNNTNDIFINSNADQYNIIGKNLRRERLRLKLTQDQLVARLQLRGLNYTRVQISLIENSKRRVYDKEEKLMEQALGLAVGTLLRDDNELYLLETRDASSHSNH